ncbi:uncharacterized protein DNG_05488 [Cephalotrichum gorgonifer]|uniref:Homeobox domain-containing protein n=1 Tax=Cephalotrichum gorgonifer TaxID=2041049 RepID=A0AAE8N0L3_9PEZI|nr:uncharacterized protein DNG_05488 [Cephalotrichum gorgonifer]
MSMLAMAAPSPHVSFTRDYPWEGPRTLTDFSPQQSEKISLPSIRQAFPELQLRIPSPQESSARGSPTTTSPTTGFGGTSTPLEYTHSPNSNKRRRYSIEDERTPASDSWAGSAQSSPYLTSGAVLSSPPIVNLPERSGERIERSRQNLPSMALPPHIAYERDHQQPMLRVKSRSQDDYTTAPPQAGPVSAPPLKAPHHAPPQFRPNPYPYQQQFHHPTRVQSMSMGSVYPFDRHYAPVAAYTPTHYHPDFVRYGDMSQVAGGDTRQRKRRGNLPKETTDKLRAWFVAHLHHPYPTEDEKQELMRQTGLQMNQISNWFINARRRQLPTMINNARAESDALHSRGGTNSQDGKIIPSTERSDFEKNGSPTPISDTESNSYDDGRKIRGGHVTRGSV